MRAEMRGAEQLLFGLLKESASSPEVVNQPSIDKPAVQFFRASVSALAGAPSVLFVSDDEGLREMDGEIVSPSAVTQIRPVRVTSNPASEESEGGR
ncbi:MAG: hypothetical protein AB7I19_13455 [Planctomycetota bacterium]